VEEGKWLLQFAGAKIIQNRGASLATSEAQQGSTKALANLREVPTAWESLPNISAFCQLATSY